MPYWQLFYHIIWSTRKREPLITTDVEPIIHELLRTKAIGLEATVFAVNGMPDHVHMIVAIPPKIAIAKFVGQVKAVASTRFNKMELSNILYWQDEYAIFSFDGKRLKNYIDYVNRQKEHHAQNSTIPILERTGGTMKYSLREAGPRYGIDSESWRSEFADMEEMFDTTAITGG